MFFKRSIDKFKQQNRALARSGLLHTLTKMQRHEFLQHCHRREYKEGEKIYYQGDPATGIYFIESGLVELSVEAVGEEGDVREMKLQISASEHFGELSLGYDLRRNTSATCLTDSVLLGFFKPDFETLKKRHPVIAVTFLETLTSRIMKQLEQATFRMDELGDSEQALHFRLRLYLNEHEEDVS